MPEFLRPKEPEDKKKEPSSPEESKEREPENVQYSVADLTTLIEIIPEEYKPFRTLLAKALVTAIPWVNHENWEKIKTWDNPVKDGDFIDVTATLHARIERERGNRSYSDYAAELLRREFGSTTLSVEKLHYFIGIFSFWAIELRPYGKQIERTLFGEGWFDKLENLLVDIEPIVKKIRETQEKIEELEKAAIMPFPQKPEDENDLEKMREYRKQLVRRHVMERFTGFDYGYLAKNGENLWEILRMICAGDINDNEYFQKLSALYKKLSGNLIKSGLTDFNFEGTAGPFNENHLKIIIDTIAESDIPIHEKTYRERYLHSQKIDYVPKDATVEYQIDKLKRELEELNKQLVEKFKEYFPIEKSQ
jgi:molybdopterin converting factor small subunit